MLTGQTNERNLLSIAHLWQVRKDIHWEDVHQYPSYFWNSCLGPFGPGSTLTLLGLEVCVLSSRPILRRKRGWSLKPGKVAGTDWTCFPACLCPWSSSPFWLHTWRSGRLAFFLVTGSVTVCGIMKEEKIKWLQKILVRADVGCSE